MKKNITLLGSTGSIGLSTLRVIRLHRDKYKIICLGAGRNVEELLKQIAEWSPKKVAVQDHHTAELLAQRLTAEHPVEIVHGTGGYVEIATMAEINTVVSAMSGAAGLIPTYEAVKAGKQVALANKETMVMAGQIIMAEAARRNAAVLPVDSEHSAILQCLRGHDREDVKRVILTASGGPFLRFSQKQLRTVSVEQALKHPNWQMGPKITIDSATLMNKGLEAIEAKWFFNLAMENIGIVIHPQSIVHSMVEYNDGSIIAQMGVPDMTIPISYALAYPRHLKTDAQALNIWELESLTFEPVDTERFPCLKLALEAARLGGTMPAVLNAANEVAVQAFLEKKVGFTDIPRLIEKTMELHNPVSIENIGSVLNADSWAREKTMEILAQDMRV